jgi:mannose-6-phosphate isomerase-like protein (cupin superfamily)
MTVDDVVFKFGVGGQNKLNSSSWILEEWKAPKTIRSWGYYRVLHDVSGAKVKELTISPGQSLSMQRHMERSEEWIVADGKCMVEHYTLPSNSLIQEILTKHHTYHVSINKWHRLFNPFNKPCHIIEVQYGDYCGEDDIERR